MKCEYCNKIVNVMIETEIKGKLNFIGCKICHEKFESKKLKVGQYHESLKDEWRVAK